MFSACPSVRACVRVYIGPYQAWSPTGIYVASSLFISHNAIMQYSIAMLVCTGRQVLAMLTLHCCFLLLLIVLVLLYQTFPSYLYSSL